MQRMVWKRLCFGETKTTAEDVARRCRKDGDEVKITHGKMGYSVLIKVRSFKRK